MHIYVYVSLSVYMRLCVCTNSNISLCLRWRENTGEITPIYTHISMYPNLFIYVYMIILR